MPMTSRSRPLRIKRTAPDPGKRYADQGKKGVYHFIFSDDITDWMSSYVVRNRAEYKKTKFAF